MCADIKSQKKKDDKVQIRKTQVCLSDIKAAHLASHECESIRV